jgi:hypothetical protein
VRTIEYSTESLDLQSRRLETGTLDNVIAKEKMLSSPSNYKVWRTIVRNVFEKEDLWDCIEPFEEEDHESEGKMDELDEVAPRRQRPNR